MWWDTSDLSYVKSGETNITCDGWNGLGKWLNKVMLLEEIIEDTLF